MKFLRSPLPWFILCLLAAAGLAALGPEESRLGSHVRIVYLHGAWALTAEAALLAAALTGLLALLLRKDGLHRWSRALGYTGLLFWLAYIPISLWAMQTNWNGLFLAEPRFRVAVLFAIAGVLLQLGLVFMGRPAITSLFNLLYFAALELALTKAAYVMHPPPSPIFSSGDLLLEGYFLAVIALVVAADFFLTLFFLKRLA